MFRDWSRTGQGEISAAVPRLRLSFNGLSRKMTGLGAVVASRQRFIQSEEIMALPCRRAIGAVLISSLIFHCGDTAAITVREGVLLGLICDAFLQEVVPFNEKKESQNRTHLLFVIGTKRSTRLRNSQSKYSVYVYVKNSQPL